MKKTFLNFAISTCLLLTSSCPAIAQVGQPRRQRNNLVKRGRSQTVQTAPEESLLRVTSDTVLSSYSTERNGDVFKVIIRQVGVFSVHNDGRGFGSFDQQPNGKDLVLTFHLDPGVSPRVEQSANQLDVFFATSQRLSRNSPGNTSNLLPSQINLRSSPGVTTAALPQLTAASVTQPPTAPLIVSALPTSAPEKKSLARTDDDAQPKTETVAPSACSTKCAKPGDDKNGPYAIVNANAPSEIEGPRRFPNGGKVFFTNMNPFKWNYRISRTETPSSGPAITTFLGFIFGDDLGTITGLTARVAGAGETKPAPPAFRRDSGAPNNCSGEDLAAIDNFLNTANALAVKITDNADYIDRESKAFNKARKAYNDFLKATDTDTEALDCSEACKAANELLPKLKKIDLSSIPNDPSQLRKEVTALDVTGSKFQATHSGLGNDNCTQQVKTTVSTLVKGLNSDLDKVDTSLAALQKAIDENQDKFDSLAAVINSVFSSINSKGNPFMQSQTLFKDDEAKDVQFTVFRKNLRIKDAQEIAFTDKPTFRVGEVRIALSAGIGFSTVNETSVVRQSALVPGPNGAMVLGTRFGFENNSTFKPSGVVMLNGNIARFGLFGKNNTTFALSSGLVLSSRSSGSGSTLATEFVAGPSLGFADNNFYFTVGFHAARIQRLAGGFKIGDPVPDNLPDPLPLEKIWRNGIIFALTYRVQPR